MRAVPALLLLASTVLLAGCGNDFRWPEPQDAGVPVPIRDDLRLDAFATGLDKPLLLLSAPDGTTLVVEQTGRVWAFPNGTKDAQPYLDLSDRVGTCHHEQGLLGLAFSPTFDADRRLFVAYTDQPCGPGDGPPKGDWRLSRFVVPAGADRPDPASETVLLRVPKPYRNHNGGHVLFGPDGHLYTAIGDGGGHGDPARNGQDKDTLLGTIMRLDVRGDGAVAPPDNPFVGKPGRDEVWMYGLRNPWRFDFDPATGDLWVADVGQDQFEEINHVPAGQAPGANLGWSLFEGDARFRRGHAPADLHFPVATYRHGETHCAVTGGPFLRGTDLPGLEGAYLFGDFCSGRLWAYGSDGRVEALMDTGLQITGFGRDADGNVYVLHWGGDVRRLTFVPDGAGGEGEAGRGEAGEDGGDTAGEPGP